MEYLVEARSEKTRKFIECLMPSIIKQLGLTQSRAKIPIDQLLIRSLQPRRTCNDKFKHGSNYK